ncbi:MAG: dTMP kinase [Candidatus Eremiobacteraeota bacterium]|nr:dTMP kinase [Candidatus Eremiobacteraeota bacterium]
MFVTLEGIEGSGKSTLLVGMLERMREQGLDVLSTREPGGTPVGDAIREVVLRPGLHVEPLTEALLMNASRAALVSDVIRPALAAGKIVLCDRYYDSTLAYQGYGRGLDLAMLRGMCAAATDGLDPDLTLILDVPPEVSRLRVESRPGANDRLDNETFAFFARARQGFLELAMREPRMRVLDATRPVDVLIDEAMAFLAKARAA